MSTRAYYEYPVSTPDLVEVVEVVAVHVELALRIRAYTHNAHRRCTARGAVQRHACARMWPRCRPDAEAAPGVRHARLSLP